MSGQLPVPGVPLRTGPRSWRRYVAIGDSLSEGLGDPVPGGGTRGWATLLAADLRRQQPDLSFTNLAVRGYMVHDAIDRQLEPALTARPDLVSIFIGGNDALLRPQLDGDRFGADLDRLVAPLAHSGATLVLSTLPDLTACSPLPPPWRGILRRRILAVNEHIRRVATVHDTVLLDAWLDARTRRHRMWSIDRIHPSAEGHRLIAASVATLLGLPVDDEAQAFVPAGIGADLLRHAREGRWLVRHGFRRGTAGAQRGTADVSPLPAEPSGELHRPSRPVPPSAWGAAWARSLTRPAPQHS